MYRNNVVTLFIVGLLLFSLVLLANVIHADDANVVNNVLDQNGERISTLPIDVTTKDQAGEIHEFILKPLIKSLANRISNKIKKVAQEHPTETKKIVEDYQTLKQRFESRIKEKVNNQQQTKQYLKQKQDEIIAGIRTNLGL